MIIAKKGFAMRLVGGKAPNQGRVEVYRSGDWGTVCDGSWDIEDAHVLCNALGHTNASEAKSGAFFGQGTGPIGFGEIDCDGTEADLLQCPCPLCHQWETSFCTHYNDAGVICSDSGKKS